MTTDPQIPFGYARVQGQLQKGDGVWDGQKFRKAKKEYPFTYYVEVFAIRKCAEQQTEIPGAESVETMEVE